MSDYNAGERGTPNGPAQYPARSDEPRPATASPAATTVDRSAASVQQIPAQQGPAQQASQPGPAQQGAAPARPAPAPAPRELKGRIHIADEVVEKVAGLAAMEVPGVADLGGDIERAIESVRERIGIGAKRGDQGVKADVLNNEVKVNVTVMVEYGHVVLEVARQVQANVARKTNRMLGLKVLEVNVTVDDVRTTKAEVDETSDAA